MYLRESRQRLADGSVLTHLQLAEDLWDPERKRAQVKIIHHCGRAETTERLRRPARSDLRRCAPEEIVADNPAWQLVQSISYGDLYVIERVWRRVDVGEVIDEVLAESKFDFDVERVIIAMVANRALGPSSKLDDQWLAEDVHNEGTPALRLHQLYRAMASLAGNKEVIEKAIYFRMTDLLNLDAEIVLYDTNSSHFEIDEPHHGVGPNDEARGSALAGKKTYRALRKCGHSKNGRFDAPQIVIGVAVTRDGLPC